MKSIENGNHCKGRIVKLDYIEENNEHKPENGNHDLKLNLKCGIESNRN